MSKRKLLYLLALAYVVLLSAVPLINDLQTINSWVGYGWGCYRYTTERFNVVYEGIPLNNDSLKLEVRPPHSFSKYFTALVLKGFEIQPQNSSGVADLKLKCLSLLRKDTLSAVYEGVGGDIQELIKVRNDGEVSIGIHCSKTCNIGVLIKHQFFNYVKPVNSLGRNSSGSSYVTYSFNLKDKLFRQAIGNISISPAPAKISVLRNGGAPYAIEVLALNSSEVNITIHGLMWQVKGVQDPSVLEWVLTMRSAHVLYITTAVLISVLWWVKWVRKRN